MSTGYAVPAGIYRAELTIKKSRFLGRAGPAPDRDAAMALLASAREDFPDAGHHCWAYVIGRPESAATAAMSDDGEPSGTAGKPILNVLQHKNVGDVMLVVTRYFGGIKLGAGGLVRAYSGAAQTVMETLPVIVRVERETISVQIGFDQEQHLRYWVEQQQGELIDIQYTHSVRATIALDAALGEAFRALCDERAWLILDD